MLAYVTQRFMKRKFSIQPNRTQYKIYIFLKYQVYMVAFVSQINVRWFQNMSLFLTIEYFLIAPIFYKILNIVSWNELLNHITIVQLKDENVALID
jgi:hypothetical protein